MIRVMIADDHQLVRQGIRALLERVRDVQVIGEADDGRQALEMVERLAPDVLLADISMPHMNGIQLAERIAGQRLATKVIILSMHTDETLVRQALKVGARGYLLKSSATEELLLAVRAAQRGELYLSPMISAAIVTDFLSAAPESPFDRLTPREREVLQLIAEGLTNAEIARRIVVSPKTVEKHRASLMEKLDVHDLAGLIRVAIKQGLISLDD